VQLGSWPDLARLIAAGARVATRAAACALVTACALVMACAAPPGAADVRVTWRTAETPVVGEPVVAEVTLRDERGRPVTGATIDIEGHMSHPGMAPVLASAEEQEDGTYRVRFALTMAGDWIVLVRGVLPDGRTVRHEVDLASVADGPRRDDPQPSG
jgi:hypothetical protein